VNAKAAVDKAKALDELAMTEEKIAVGLQKVDPGAISDLKVAKAVQNRQAADATLKQSQAGVNEALAAQSQADAAHRVKDWKSARVNHCVGFRETSQGSERDIFRFRRALKATSMPGAVNLSSRLGTVTVRWAVALTLDYWRSMCEIAQILHNPHAR
jgi:hypothetical protein